MELHEVNLEELNLSWFETGKVESEASSSNDGGSFRYDKDRGCNSFKGMIDAVDSLAFSSASILVEMYGPPVKRIFIVW